MAEQMANFGHTTLNEGAELSSGDTTVTVTDGSVLSSSGNFRVRVDDEIMLVTARSSNDLTVTRGAEGTSAVAHDDGSDVDAVLTAAGLLAMIQENPAPDASIGVILDVPAVSGQLDIIVPFACTIADVTVLADASGSIVVDIWKDTYANFPPVDGDSITASAPPTLSSEAKSQDSTLTGWTTALAKGDVLRFNVDSVSTVTRVLVQLGLTR